MSQLKITIIIEVLIVIMSSASPDPAVKPHVSCTTHIFKGDFECAVTRTRFAHLYLANMNATPEILPDLTFEVYPRANHVTRHPYINFTITPNIDSSLEYVLGFELSLRNEKNESLCVILDMTNSTWQIPEDYLTPIQLPPLPLESGEEYTAVLVSLPNSDRSDSLSAVIPPHTYSDIDAASKWTPEMTVHVFEKEQRVELFFGLAPAELNFTEYEITLYGRNGGETTKVIVNETNHNFTRIPPGDYVLSMRPYDPYYSTMDVSRCLCFFGSHAYCKRCGFSRYPKVISISHGLVATTEGYTSSSEQPTHIISTQIPPVMRKADDSFWQQTPLYVGVACGVIFVMSTVVLIICRVYHWNKVDTTSYNTHNKRKDLEVLRQWSTDSESDGITVVQLSRQKEDNDRRIVPSQKKILLTYEEEEDVSYRHVTDAFATYLHSHCFCDVMVVPWRQSAAWVTTVLDKANVLVVMDTETAYDRYKTMKYKYIHSQPNDESILGKMIRNDIYQGNALTVRISHENSDPARSLCNFGFENHFDFPKDHDAFLKGVHRIAAEVTIELTKLPKTIGDSEEGRNVMDSIKLMSKSSNLSADQSGSVLSYSCIREVTLDMLDPWYPYNVGQGLQEPVDFRSNDIHLDVWTQGDNCESNTEKPEVPFSSSLWVHHGECPNVYQSVIKDCSHFLSPDDLDVVSQSVSNQLLAINNNYLNHVRSS